MRKGFSLIEILVVVAIATSIVLVVSKLTTNVSLLNGFISQELQSKSDISQTLQIITSEIRSAQTSASGAYPIESASTSSFVFYSNYGNSGVAERIRLFISSSSIYRGVTQPTGTPAVYTTSTETVTDLIDNVTVTTSSPLFSYYNASYTGTGSAMTSTVDVSGIRLVAMSFFSDVQPQQSPVPQYFSILVDIRNLRSN